MHLSGHLPGKKRIIRVCVDYDCVMFKLIDLSMYEYDLLTHVVEYYICGHY